MYLRHRMYLLWPRHPKLSRVLGFRIACETSTPDLAYSACVTHKQPNLLLPDVIYFTEKPSEGIVPGADARSGKSLDWIGVSLLALDSETTLRGIPPAAWDYRLGNRCALEWVLDQYKEKKPKDPTIREKFDTYRFSDYKERVIDLLMRVTTVSVETERLTQAMKAAAR